MDSINEYLALLAPIVVPPYLTSRNGTSVSSSPKIIMERNVLPVESCTSLCTILHVPVEVHFTPRYTTRDSGTYSPSGSTTVE